MLFVVKNLQYKLSQYEILKTQSFSLKPGEHCLILGPSGSGKTTLLNLLSGLLKLEHGEITFNHQKYSICSENQLDDLRLKNFGFIFQKLHLMNHLNVFQNIILAQNKPDNNFANHLIKTLQLESKKEKLASQLSFGEAQRVAIARGIVNKPMVVFADEPTSSLDDMNTDIVMKLIFSQAKRLGTSLIVSTHDLRIKKYFNESLKVNL